MKFLGIHRTTTPYGTIRCGHPVEKRGKKTGADETISDYGFLGIGTDWMLQDLPRSLHPKRTSQPFPQLLDGIFPWKNFFLGAMRWVLSKEESVMGAHGIESRYPFLSNRVVQEYLWLTPEAKNRVYKASLNFLEITRIFL